MELLWRERFRVRFYDADAHGCVTLQAICRFLQVAADEHARTAGASMDALKAAGRMWVLAELSLSVRSFLSMDQQLTVETWGSSRMAGARAYRDFLLFNEADQCIGSACTLWLYLDAATRHPMRLPEAIMAFRVSDREPVSPEAFQPVSTAEWTAVGEVGLRVGWQDLDQNNHANNVRYLEWGLQAVPDKVWQAYRPCAVTLRFNDEARLGDLIESAVRMVETDGGLRMEHSLRRRHGGAVAQISTRWVHAV